MAQGVRKMCRKDKQFEKGKLKLFEVCGRPADIFEYSNMFIWKSSIYKLLLMFKSNIINLLAIPLRSFKKTFFHWQLHNCDNWNI